MENCGIVKDLLPSYQEELVTEASKELIESHLQICPDCKRYQEAMKNHNVEQERKEIEKGKKFGKKLLGYKQYIMGFVVGLVAPVVVIALFCLLMALKSFVETMLFSYEMF